MPRELSEEDQKRIEELVEKRDNGGGLTGDEREELMMLTSFDLYGG
ncbi:hypothetical protein [Seinonella peptonophila]|nr:hypothetical protein [Seinonella peptonophila]